MPLTNKFACFWCKSCRQIARIILLALGFGLLLPPVTLANWVPTLPLQTSHERHTATVMHSGQVLVAGGYDSNSYYPDNILKSSEIYDPISHSWTNTVGHLSYERFWHTATLLGDGQVLVSGGQSTYLAGEELYHPDPGTWRTVGKLNTSRYGHAATLLPNNLVLVTGGSSGLDEEEPNSTIPSRRPGVIPALCRPTINFIPPPCSSTARSWLSVEAFTVAT